jgi:hypothetical protein
LFPGAVLATKCLFDFVLGSQKLPRFFQVFIYPLETFLPFSDSWKLLAPAISLYTSLLVARGISNLADQKVQVTYI